MRPYDYQPRLNWWSHCWRLAAMVALSGLELTVPARNPWNSIKWLVATDLILGVACYVVVWWRRRHPVAVCTFINLAAFVSLTAAGPATLALVSLSTRRRWREIVPQAVLAFLGGATIAVYVPGASTSAQPLLVTYALLLAINGMTIGWGLYLGSRRELVGTWRSRAMAAEAEQQANVSRARSVERSRIAREMHDVLAHRISAVSMHAGALAYRRDLPHDEVRAAATIIQENSHQALTELRQVLGVLREGPGDAHPEQPQAGPTDVDGLVVENRSAGMRVDYRCDADLATVSAGTVRTLYRCLQEALTNARKHAPATAVSVRVETTAEPEPGVLLEVVNPLAVQQQDATTPGAGLGLVGVAERVALTGGHESHSRTATTFTLRVWLPCEAP